MQKVLCLTGLTVLLLGGCTSYGKKVTHDELAQFQPGVTLCNEIAREKPYGLGKPSTDTRRSDKTRQLVYTYGHSEVDAGALALAVLGIPAGRSTTEQTNVVIDCDAQGVLQTYSSSTGQMGTGVGVTGGAKQ